MSAPREPDAPAPAPSAEARDLNRQEERRLREISDGRVYSTICWPKTFERLIDRGYAEGIVSSVTLSGFTRITDAGRAYLAARRGRAAEGGGSDG